MSIYVKLWLVIGKTNIRRKGGRYSDILTLDDNINLALPAWLILFSPFNISRSLPSDILYNVKLNSLTTVVEPGVKCS